MYNNFLTVVCLDMQREKKNLKNTEATILALVYIKMFVLKIITYVMLSVSTTPTDACVYTVTLQSRGRRYLKQKYIRYKTTEDP